MPASPHQRPWACATTNFDQLRIIADDGGCSVADLIREAVDRYLADWGLDASKVFPTVITDEVARAADVIVTMAAATPAPAAREDGTWTGT
jgi:hypothetical protein